LGVGKHDAHSRVRALTAVYHLVFRLKRTCGRQRREIAQCPPRSMDEGWGVHMPIVFVHGVATREGPRYTRESRLRNALLRRLILPLWEPKPRADVIFNPYWGDLGATPRWNLACLPAEGLEAFGTAATWLPEAMTTEAAPATSPNRILLDTSRHDLLDGIDLLWTAAAQLDTDAEQLADLAAATIEYARPNKRPAWLDEVDDDRAFLARLEREVGRTTEAGIGPERTEAFGVGDRWIDLKRATRFLRSAMIDTAGKQTMSFARQRLALPMALFLGDVFKYLSERGTAEAPGPIVRRVLAACEEGRAVADATNSRLIVIGHSLGGVIACDVLSGFSPQLDVDVLVTVGSQVGLFEELKLFVASDAAVPRDDMRLAERPQRVRAWINTLDYGDALAFEVGRVFHGATDYAYKTGSLRRAHSSYLVQPGFYERLRANLATVLSELDEP
jgi:hypothetical protein